MLNFEQACLVADAMDLERANMAAPHPQCVEDEFHFSQEFRDVALRHVWARAACARALEISERGAPHWI